MTGADLPQVGLLLAGMALLLGGLFAYGWHLLGGSVDEEGRP